MDSHNHKTQSYQLTPVGEVRSEIKSPLLLAGESDIELQERLDTIREYHQQVCGSADTSELDIQTVAVKLNAKFFGSFSATRINHWRNNHRPGCLSPVLVLIKVFLAPEGIQVRFAD